MCHRDYYDYDDDYRDYRDDYRDYRDDPRAKRKRHAKPGEHIMNKDEGKLMRRLKNDTGLTEKEIRAIKKYRVMLSEAQTVGTKPKMTELEKARKEVMRHVCCKLSLSREHPDVIKEYRKEWNRRRGLTCYGYRNIYSKNKPFKE